MYPSTHASPKSEDPSRRIFIIDAATTSDLACNPALVATGDVIVLTDASSLTRALEDGRGGIVVCEWSDSIARWLEKTSAAPRVIHYGPTLPDSALEAIGHGLDVAHADDVDRLVALLSPSRAKRNGARVRMTGLQLRAVGLEGTYPVIDVSNDGVAFEVGEDTAREPPLAGFVIGDLELDCEGAIVLASKSAIVSHVSATARGTYVVGCELTATTRPRSERARRILRGTAETTGLLIRALKTTGISVRGTGETILLDGATGTIDTERGDITLAGVNPTFRPHVVARGHFELGGALYRFASSVISDVPLRIKLPIELEETRQRDMARYRPSKEKPLTVEITTPFSDAPARRSILDLSSGGLSFTFDPEIDVLPVGLRLTSIAVALGDEVFRARGVVRSVTHALSPHGKARCGVVLEGLSDTQRAHLAERIVRLQFPGLEDGAGAPFDELIGFFRRAGYLDADREQSMAPMIPSVRRTFGALSARRNGLLRSLVYRDEQQIIGHISSVRAYQHTYMVQHLASAAGRLTGHAGLFLSIGNAEYLMHDAKFDYLKIWFHAQNKFPARVFGGFARKVRNPDLCVLETFAHTTLSTIAGKEDDSIDSLGIEIGEASPEDRAIVAQHFVRTRAPLVVRSDDLARNALTLGDLDSSYRELGLERRRVVLLARQGGAPLGFALVELSSPGLNLFEALSRFSIHLLPAGESIEGGASTVRRALLAEIRAFYRNAGRSHASALIPILEAPEYEALGLAIDPEHSVCLTTRRTQLRKFAEHMGQMIVPRRPRRAGPRVTSADDDVA